MDSYDEEWAMFPAWRHPLSGPRDHLHAPGRTGDALRNLPDSVWAHLDSELSSKPSENPWEILTGLIDWGPPRIAEPIAKRVLHAGSSQWAASNHLSHIANGGASVRSDFATAFAKGDRSEMAWRSVDEMYFGQDRGRKFLENVPPDAQDQSHKRLAAWEKRKRHQSARHAEPKQGDYEKAPILLRTIVQFWMIGPASTSGFAWCGNQVAAAILEGPRAMRSDNPDLRGFNIDGRGFKKAYQRIGLRKVESIVYSAEWSARGLLFRLRNGDEIDRLTFSQR